MSSTQRIVHGDSKEKLKKIPDCSIGAIITDPPAGIAFMAGSGKDWDDYGDLQKFQESIYIIFKEAIRVLKPGGFVICWAIPRSAHHTAMGLERAGFKIKDKIYHIYGQGFPKASKLDSGIKKEGGNVEEWKSYKTPSLKPAAEEWIIAQKPMIDEGEPNEIDFKAPFFYCAKTNSKERTCGGKVKNNHPTIKSVKLMEYFIDLLTPPESYKKNFIVLDPFAGSGTTLLACKNKDVNAIGIEKDEDYVKIIQERLQHYEA